MRFSNEAEVLDWIRQTAGVWLFLDYDGTLAEFSKNPGIVEQNPAVLQVLDRLIKTRPDIRIAVISGRRLEDIRKLVPLEGIFLAGAYGIQVQLPGGDEILRDDFHKTRPTLDELKPQWEALIVNEDGFYLEDKGWSLAIHARYASEKAASEKLLAAKSIAERISFGNYFRLLGGHRFFEIAPAKANKGKTVAYFMEKFPKQDMRPVYCGDDDKDEEAFSVVHEKKGINVWVLHNKGEIYPSLVDFVIDSPRNLRIFLNKI